MKSKAMLGISAAAAALSLAGVAGFCWDAPDLAYLSRSPDGVDWRLNLHNHSYCSDGMDTPEEVVRLARKAGIRALALTDHDTVDCLERAREEARKAGLTLIPGVELSVADDSIHILGLGVDPASPALNGLLERGRSMRVERTKLTAQKLGSLGVDVSPEEVVSGRIERARWAEGLPGSAGSAGISEFGTQPFGSISRPDIARVLVQKGYVPDVQAAFERYLGEQGAGYVPLEGPDFEEAVAAVHAAGGVAVLAHPYRVYALAFPRKYSGREYRNFNELAQAMMDAGLDGFEQYKNRRRPAPWLVEMALAHGRKSGKTMLLTPGSDYHGADASGDASGERELSAIAIPRSEAENILGALNAGRVNGK